MLTNCGGSDPVPEGRAGKAATLAGTDRRNNKTAGPKGGGWPDGRCCFVSPNLPGSLGEIPGRSVCLVREER